MYSNRFQQLDDLSLHDEIYSLVREGKAPISDEDATLLICEATKRNDIVLVASAVELSENYRNDETLKCLRRIINRGISGKDLDILILDEFRLRLPRTDYTDFLPFLDIKREKSVREFCAKVLFTNQIFCPEDKLTNKYKKENNIIVSLYLSAALFINTNKNEYFFSVSSNRNSANLDVARLSREIMTKLGYS